MGKGDKRTFKGKVFKGSYGKTRSHDGRTRPTAKPATTATAKAKKK